MIVSFISGFVKMIFQMRICVYGNLANNAYNVTKFLRKMGYNAEVGLDPDDRFPMSQPIWEDLDFEMSVAQFSDKSVDYWLSLEKEKGYTRPNWVRYIGKPSLSVARLVKLNIIIAFSHPSRTLKAVFRSPRGLHDLIYGFLQMTKVISLSEYDFVIGFGLAPSIAYLSEIRYVSIPYGADLTVVPFQTDHSKWALRARARLQRVAYQNSDAIFLYNDPTLPELLKKLGITKWHNFNMPIDMKKYRPLQNQKLEELIDPKIAEKTKNKIVMLMPSRLDFEVKGSDKALRAFARLIKMRRDVFLVMMEWGADLGKAKKMISELGITDYVYFHPYVVSKPRLVRLINAVDIILDQFGPAGMYGTTTIETLSCGKPLIINIDWQKMQSYFDSKPPVMYARTEDEILDAMSALCNSEYREEIGKKQREWVISNHSAEKNLSKIIEIMKSGKNAN